MKKIIIVGYPKSGNTWLTRLTADIVNCPVKGFLYSDYKEMATEGLNRPSNYEVYKSHHQHHEITKEDKENSKLIYIIRDPRDVSISGQNYFKLRLISNSNSSNRTLKNSINFLIKVLNHAYTKFFGRKIMKREMHKAILKGNKDISHWCRIDWKSHIKPYIKDNNILKIKYENLLYNPLKECKKIVEFLDIERSDKDVLNAINNQSFDTVKEKFAKQNKKSYSKFLRKGKAQQWKTVFTKKENQLYLKTLKEELITLNYESSKSQIQTP